MEKLIQGSAWAFQNRKDPQVGQKPRLAVSLAANQRTSPAMAMSLSLHQPEAQ